MTPCELIFTAFPYLSGTSHFAGETMLQPNLCFFRKVVFCFVNPCLYSYLCPYPLTWTVGLILLLVFWTLVSASDAAYLPACLLRTFIDIYRRMAWVLKLGLWVCGFYCHHLTHNIADVSAWRIDCHVEIIIRERILHWSSSSLYTPLFSWVQHIPLNLLVGVNLFRFS